MTSCESTCGNISATPTNGQKRSLTWLPDRPSQNRSGASRSSSLPLSSRGLPNAVPERVGLAGNSLTAPLVDRPVNRGIIGRGEMDEAGCDRTSGSFAGRVRRMLPAG